MTPAESATILGLLSAGFPAIQVSQETAIVWMEALADIDPQDALPAARTLIKRAPRFPTVSQLREEAESLAHARRNREATDRGLPARSAVGVRPERLEEILAGLRARMAVQRGTRGHWHGGPEPCPVCGGLAPPRVAKPAVVARVERPVTGEPLVGCGIKNCRTCYGD